MSIVQEWRRPHRTYPCKISGLILYSKKTGAKGRLLQCSFSVAVDSPSRARAITAKRAPCRLMLRAGLRSCLRDFKAAKDETTYSLESSDSDCTKSTSPTSVALSKVSPRGSAGIAISRRPEVPIGGRRRYRSSGRIRAELTAAARKRNARLIQQVPPSCQRHRVQAPDPGPYCCRTSV